MAPETPAARRRFGAQLRKYREQAAVSQSALARDIPLAQSMLSAIELGKKSTKEHIVARIDEVLRTGGTLHRAWHSYRQLGGHADWFKGIVQQEQKASVIREYGLALVPGVLQTRSYARTVIRDGRPTDLEKEIDELVSARMERKALLEAERPPQLCTVLDETVLTRPVGGHATMREQLEHLLDSSLNERITIQVVPFDTRRCPGLSGPFTLITTPGEPEILYAETPLRGEAVDDPETVSQYNRLFGALQGVAYPPDESRDKMHEIRKYFQ
ncbi:helix-turn-helix domain-containing protein [Spiractinospora alimapuensis]|uniref:helix-turn-helix domain-containing protein n=1 Tax=Spiractinospora alimapuensis TaxID=2820884 RepID=UPI001F3E41B9|nr:helix-turn-helix transcriptional regulator [Spiractinospora alimapuensis]QVQ52197.1 helix-turn-helix domain-containing protein [Spiractinospora alimapuensis]